ncbi:MAG TPA: high-potential iron-sulfur protein [Steroidobacteraceae bacterium]|jgi:hypothetical protein
MTDKISRRALLWRGLQLPVGGALVLALGACSKGGPSASGGTTAAAVGGTVCADPSAMTDAEHSTRTSLGYAEKSPNPAQTCAGCAFFHAAAEGGDCGTCDMMSGGPVNSHGHCNSWSAKT